MLTLDDFNYDLPDDLIAQHPAASRTASRLLHVEQTRLRNLRFSDLPDLVQPGDLLVFNDTKVIKARLFGRKESGGQVEIMIERISDERRAVAQIRASKSPKPGNRIIVEDAFTLRTTGRTGAASEFFALELEGPGDLYALIEQHGRLPLPPYIAHSVEVEDEARYQTVFAQNVGAVAAIKRTREQKGRVIAVGTTSLRALESAAQGGELRAGKAETDIFITPGYRFRVVDRLITNFHLPKSTLLMLVSAFAGSETIRNAYCHAVAERYRFFSYGDAMFLERQNDAI